MWRGVQKPQGSFLASSSPAFDFSFLTACFLSFRGKGQRCTAMIDGCEVNVQSYDLSQNGKVYIGTSYPAIGRGSRTCDDSYNQRKVCCRT